MSKPSKTDRKKSVYAETSRERVDLLFDEVSFAIQWQRPSILLVFYGSEFVRNKAEHALEERLTKIGQQLVQIKVNGRHFDIPLLLSKRPDRERTVYSVSGLSSGGGKDGANAYRALNIRREYFVDYSIRTIIWLLGDEAIELSRNAPDFWAFRHRVVDLNDASELERPTISPNELSLGGQEFPNQSEDLDEQIEVHEALIRELPNQAEFILKRLDLLLVLAKLYQAKQAYDQSIQRFKQGIVIAKQSKKEIVLAKFWGNLGSVYLELDQLPRAIRAYRKAIRLNPQDVEIWINLGHAYHIEKRLSNAIIAYKQAILLDPQNPPANSSLVACYRLLGKDDLAEKRRKFANRIMENETEYNRAVFASVCGNTGKAIELLAAALEKKQVSANVVRHDPNLDFIRDDPRFEQLPGLAAPNSKDRSFGT